MSWSGDPIKVASRASRLARLQVEEFFKELTLHHPAISYEALYLETVGDRDQTSSLKEMERSDFFTREIDQMLLRGEVQLAIHSAKDLPDPLPHGLKLVAVTQGVDPSDVLVVRSGSSLSELPQGAVVGSSSTRRDQLLLQLRPDLTIREIRGTIDRRLEQLDEGLFDALVMAKAALIRLGIDRPTIELQGPTAPLQGRLAAVARADDLEMQRLCVLVDRRRTVLYLGTELPSAMAHDEKWEHCPLIQLISRPLKSIDLERFWQELPHFTHLFLTSKQATDLLAKALAELGLSLQNGQKIIAVGPATAKRAARQGWEVAHVCHEMCQEGMIQFLKQHRGENLYIGYPHSSLARPLLRVYMAEMKVRFCSAVLYDTVEKAPAYSIHPQIFDSIIFTSPSVVRAFYSHFGYLPDSSQAILQGPVTEQEFISLSRSCSC